MEFRKLVENLRQKAEVNPHQGLLLEAADKMVLNGGVTDN